MISFIWNQLVSLTLVNRLNYLAANTMPSNATQDYNKPKPADSYTCTRPEQCVKLKIPEQGSALEIFPAMTIPEKIHAIASDFPNHTALINKRAGEVQKITYREYEETCRNVAKAFLKLGLQKFQSVGILGFNSPEWFISSLGAIFAGGLSCGIYTTNRSDACFHVLESSSANIVVVEDEMQLAKILEIKSKLPKLKAIIQYTGTPSQPGVLSWQQLLDLGKNEPDDPLDEILKSLAPNQCCTLVYTSGTMGKPKAAMLTHDNLLWDALTIATRVHMIKASEIIISYLPLSHIAAQTVDVYLVLTVAGTTYFADKNALKGTLINTLLECQPTRFLGVPRVWEKIHEKMMQVAAKNGYLKTLVATWAKNKSLNYYTDKMNKIDNKTLGYNIAKSLIFSKIKQALGFTRCLTYASAAAPLSPEIRRYFMSIDMCIQDVFGMTETGGGHTMCSDTAFNFSSIGPALSGTKTKIINKDENGHGEICMFGRHIFMGYLNDPDKTKEAIDEDGWLHSGDLGYIDEEGLIYITGRLKEILITAGGENVAPIPIEERLKENLPYASNVMLIGDQRKFLSVLIALKTEQDLEGVPTDKLTTEVHDWLKKLGCPATTVTEVCAGEPHPNLTNAIQKALDKTNEKAISNAQKIQKMQILPNDFSVAGGELGPTMKLKRSKVLKKYGEMIDKIYKDAAK